MKPSDISDRPWIRLGSHAWTDETFRRAAMSRLDAFVSSVSWAKSWVVSERIADHGVHVRMPFGPTASVDLPRALRPRAGTPFLVVIVEQHLPWAKARLQLETSAMFPSGAETTAMSRATIIDEMIKALNAEHRRALP